MSASLVGSEMCIRDRPASAPALAPALARRLSAQARSRRPRACVRGRESVSYTHLTLPTICSV
eukprot:14563802-Alexandrium_andersonii.AAC.1